MQEWVVWVVARKISLGLHLLLVYLYISTHGQFAGISKLLLLLTYLLYIYYYYVYGEAVWVNQERKQSS